MISETVKQKIESRATEMAATHPAVVRAKAGEMGSHNVANYLASLRLLLSQTVPHLRKARGRAIQLGHHELLVFIERKIDEEDGHEEWAQDDIRELERHSGGAILGRPLPAVVELVEYLAGLTETDPRLYAVYSLCTEYFTVVAGPTWIRALTENCGVPPEALTAASKHVVADRAHAEHGFAVLDQLITDPAMAPAVVDTVDRTMGLFDKLFQQVADSSS